MATAATEVAPTQIVTVASGGFNSLPSRVRIAIMVGIAGIIAIAVSTILWVRSPDYRVLFSNLSDRDGGAIVAALGQMNVPYKFADGGGAILVPAAQVHDVRLRLASQGLPRGGSVGFELLEQQKFGITQFQEQVNYQRALEGELARSVQSLGQVQSARVHLAIPKPSVFLRETQKPTASVLVTLYPNKSLDRAQINGIVHLVSASVPELTTKNVSVVDQTGALLSGNGEAGELRLDPTQLAYVQQVESQLVKRINDLLEPILGRANFRAQINADVDFTQTESTDERYKPNGNPGESTVRSTQTSESASTGPNSTPQGIPGALSNQPPGQTTAAIVAPPARPGAAQAGEASDTVVRNPAATQRSSVINYEVDKTVRHTRGPTGAIKRLSAAVVVNYRKPAEGEEKPAPLSEREIADITALVREAMGFREDRGDSLKVTAAPFSIDAQETPAEVPIWQRPEMINLGIEALKYLLVALFVGYLFLGVLRPILKQFVSPPPVQVSPLPGDLALAGAGATTAAALEQNASAGRAAALGTDGAAPDAETEAKLVEQPEDEDDLLLPMQKQDKRAIANILRGPDKVLNAKEIAKQDPKLVANVLRNWVNGSNGDE